MPSHSGIDRRKFLAASGWLALGTTVLTAAPVAAHAVKFNSRLHRVASGRLTMGTYMNVICFHPSRAHAEEAIGKAYGEVDRLIDILNCHSDTTPVGHLNRSGRLTDVPPEMEELLQRSLAFNKASGGAFDVTVKPVLDLYRTAFERTGNPPDAKTLSEMTAATGCEHLRLENGGIRFEREAMGLTFDGIGKGYIVDRAIEILEGEGIEHALVNAGGDIRVIGARGDGKPWRIGVQDPWNPSNTLEVVEMSKGAIATSGNYEVYFDREKQYHHLISPRAGKPASGPVSASVMADDVTTADALSTSTFVLGMGEGLRLLQNTPKTAGLLIDRHNHRVSSGWPRSVA